MNNQTSCWDCGAVYPMNYQECPACRAANANVQFDRAVEQLAVEPCRWCGLPVTEQTDRPADYCTHDSTAVSADAVEGK